MSDRDAPRPDLEGLLETTDHDRSLSGSASVLLADAGWLALQDRIVMGLCHDLNGRIAALSATSQLTAMGEPLPGGFADEVERLESLSRRMADLVGELHREPAPSALPDLLERALAIHAGLKDASGRGVEIASAGELPAVLVNEGRCLRTLLLFVDMASNASGEPKAALTLRGDPEGVEIEFHVGDSSLDEDGVAALDRLAALDGGGVSIEGSGCVLSLPSLARSRAGYR